ncbi:TerB family tellurite resistance protein [Acuticoccus sp. MNP-M23]|uniref:tellurite resistance TerB family protein n=1 Tax=Acuticoccus sp. MNP-M23 TaxID=3072793 RepID=UPI002815DA5D|nr:TerB family tellurite resistance protein [Acuticoccus sp. MNP-M23]WMS44840.1 TerB family tellurite resistance protein [Acuticoccus sp. MNP-M23]
MLQTITDWINNIAHAGEGEDKYGSDDPKLSVAAILVHVIAVDGVVTDDEKRRLREVLASNYGLTAEETEQLVEEATVREDDAVDLYSFTSVLKRELDDAGRHKVVESMWEIVFADGEVSEFEDNVVWRVAELIGISTRDRMTLRHKIEAKTKGES